MVDYILWEVVVLTCTSVANLFEIEDQRHFLGGKNFGTSPTEITSMLVQLAFRSFRKPTCIFAQSKVGYSRLYFRVTRFWQVYIGVFCTHIVNWARMFIVLAAHEFCTKNIGFQIAPASKHANHVFRTARIDFLTFCPKAKSLDFSGTVAGFNRLDPKYIDDDLS